VAAVLVDPVLVDLGALPVGQPVASVLAQNPEPPPGKGDEFGKASPVGLVVIILLFLATIVLIRSMNKHLRKVPASFEKHAGGAEGGAADADAAASEVAAAPTRVTRSGDDSAEEPARD
jgi:hypothetical protein